MKDRLIDQILQKEIKIGGTGWRAADVLFIVCVLAFGFAIRWQLFPIESADYWGFLKDWMQQIRENGGFASLKLEISNYASPYMYIMCAVSYLTSDDLYALKLVSVFFDYVAAFAMLLLIYRLTGEKVKAILGLTAVVLCPTVIINSAYWCQCDIIYVSFLLLALYAFFKDRGNLCLICVGLAFSFKVQAVFLLPFLVIMWLKKQTVKLRHFLWIPVIYVVTAVPAWLAGRSLKDLLMIYVNQAGTYPWGTLEYPNIYALLGEAKPDLHYADEVSGAGLFATILLLGAVAYYLYGKKIEMNRELLVTLALFTVAVSVFCLPHMHERYGLLVDILAVLYGLLNVKRMPVAVGFVLVSMLSYMPYLIAVHIFPVTYVALGLLGLILYVGYDLYKQITAADRKIIPDEL